MELTNLNTNAYALKTHTHVSDEGAPEFWLQNALNSVITNKVWTQYLNLISGLASNTWVEIYPQNTLKKYKVYLVKVILECGSIPPYSGAAIFQMATTNCNATNIIYAGSMMVHNGNSIAIELRASGGAQTSPKVELRFPATGIPSNSLVTCEFLELF